MRTLTQSLMCLWLALGAPAPAAAAGATAPAPAAAVADTAAPATAAAEPAASHPEANAASVDGEFITLDKVDQRIASQLLRMSQERYEMRAQVLEAMLNEQVLDREARAQKLSVEQLIEQRVAAKLPAATAAEIDSFFMRNRGQMAAQTLEQSTPKIIETLKSNRLAAARAEYLKTLRKRHAARILIEPPRFAVSLDDDPSHGSASAPVTIVEFSDFQCPYCSRGEDTIDQVVAKYGDRVRLVFRDFPLSIHPNAKGAAIAGNCAREQGKYWEMNRAMFLDAAKLSTANLATTAESLGLDVARFKACMESNESRAEVEKDMTDGQALGISGTPTFFVNGVMIVGAQPPEVFTRTIDRELERLGR